jgi:molecular chaperone DnaK
MGRILGIDLGTTNSEMAVMEKEGPIIIPNNIGERITPSVVAITKSGEILVGKKAKRGAVMNVGRTIFSIKRHMGTNYKVNIEGKEYTPQEISAMIFQKLKHDAEDYFGEEINQAVITVPAYFTDAQRQATRDSGEIAGLKVRRIIDEPTAAALAYGLDKDKDQIILVYDFGGGTFDVSIIEIISGVFQVLAIQGNNRLGGDDLDKIVMNYLAEEFKKKTGFNLLDDPIAMQRLKDASEDAKIELSEINEARILIEAIAMTDKGPVNLDMTLTRKKFEELTEHLIKQTIPPLEQAIVDAGLTKEKINNILLVGGSTRIPLVQNLVKEVTIKQPLKNISPEEVVALGAAVQTLVLAPLGEDIEETLATRYGREKPVIIHMTPFSLGVGLKDDQYGVIIERNSTYPTEAKDVFTTTRDFQEAISFPIYEGEESIASENSFLDMLRIEEITPAPRGVPRIEVTFKLNQDRILEVTAEDLATGVEKTITIEATDNRLTESDKQRMIKEARSRVTQMLRAKISESVQEEGAQLLKRAQKVLETVSSDARIILDKEIRGLRDVLITNDSHLIEDKVNSLTKVITDLEAAI